MRYSDGKTNKQYIVQTFHPFILPLGPRPSCGAAYHCLFSFVRVFTPFAFGLPTKYRLTHFPSGVRHKSCAMQSAVIQFHPSTDFFLAGTWCRSLDQTCLLSFKLPRLQINNTHLTARCFLIKFPNLNAPQSLFKLNKFPFECSVFQINIGILICWSQICINLWNGNTIVATLLIWYMLISNLHRPMKRQYNYAVPDRDSVDATTSCATQCHDITSGDIITLRYRLGYPVHCCDSVISRRPRGTAADVSYGGGR